jgi:predicted transcriptional regulator
MATPYTEEHVRGLILDQLDRRGGMTAKALRFVLDLDRSTVHAVLAKLERDGDIQAYYKDGWKLAVQKTDLRRAMDLLQY